MPLFLPSSFFGLSLYIGIKIQNLRKECERGQLLALVVVAAASCDLFGFNIVGTKWTATVEGVQEEIYFEKADSGTISASMGGMVVTLNFTYTYERSAKTGVMTVTAGDQTSKSNFTVASDNKSMTITPQGGTSADAVTFSIKK